MIKYKETIVNLTSSGFDIKAWDKYDEADELFVYGTVVDNYLTVDNQELGLLALGGVKELRSQVNVLLESDITVGPKIDSNSNTYKLCYDETNFIIGNNSSGFVNPQFIINKGAPINSLVVSENGYVYNNGTIVSSDRRIKTDIENISDEECLNKINSLNVVKYNYTDPSLNGNNKVIGFIAQEVEKVVPEAVFKTSDDDYGFNDRPLVALLTKTIQEQEVRITKLEKLVQELMGK
jgi:hypothetical protein